MLAARPEAVAVISAHASPLAELGRGENGGMNVAIRQLCAGLSLLGIPTDVFVRRDDALAPDEELIAPLSRLVRLPVGPPRAIPKSEVRALCDAFAAAVLSLRIERSGTAVVLSWTPADAILQEALSVDGAWQDVSPHPITPYTINSPTGSRFYRLWR